MLGWALLFLIVALVAGLFGFGGIASAAVGIAQALFFLFIVMFAVFLVMGLFSGRRTPPLCPHPERIGGSAAARGRGAPCLRTASVSGEADSGTVGMDIAGEHRGRDRPGRPRVGMQRHPPKTS